MQEQQDSSPFLSPLRCRYLGNSLRTCQGNWRLSQVSPAAHRTQPSSEAIVLLKGGWDSHYNLAPDVGLA